MTKRTHQPPGKAPVVQDPISGGPGVTSPGRELYPCPGNHIVSITLALAAVALSASAAQVAPAAPHTLKRYCAGCHNDKVKTGGFMLNTLDINHVDQHSPDWEKIVRKLADALDAARRDCPGPMRTPTTHCSRPIERISTPRQPPSPIPAAPTRSAA